MIRSVVSESTLQEAALGNHKGLAALAKRKTGDEKDTMMRAAEMMKKGQVKDLNMFMKAMDQSTHKAIMPFVDKKHYKALHEDIEEIDEKTLTPAELKKREEIAKAIERENPDMPMPQKMAIATAQAKKVAEDKEEIEEDSSYKTGSEKHTDGGHRAHIKNPRGGTTYLGSTTYKTAKHAKGEADAWHNAYFNTPGMKSKGNPRGAERAAHDYRKKNAQHVVEEISEAIDDEGKMARGQLMRMAKQAAALGNMMSDDKQLDGWVQSKLTKASDYLDSVHDYLMNNKQDVDEEVIDEARGGADEPDRHIIMQLRKAQDVDGNHPITFRGGKTAKVQKKHIDKILKTHDHPSVKPVQKRMMRVAISKSPQHLASFADKLKEDFNVEDIDTILQETKGAPKGYHFTRSGQLKKGDAGQDGPGGAMLRSDPLDKVRKKIPPLPEEADDNEKEVIHTRKADFKLSKVRLPDGRLAYRKVKKEIDIEK